MLWIHISVGYSPAKPLSPPLGSS